MGGYISSVLCNIVGVVYPAYASFKALETPGDEDDKQWLTYWVVFAALTIVEDISDLLVFWLPFYFEAKLAVLILLQVPQLNLSAVIYSSYIRPFFKSKEKEIDASMAEVASKITEKATQLSKDGVKYVVQKSTEIIIAETVSKATQTQTTTSLTQPPTTATPPTVPEPAAQPKSKDE